MTLSVKKHARRRRPIGCSERRPAATVGETLGDGLSHRFSHTPSFIQAGAEDGRAAPRIADLAARCTESSDFRVSLAPIVVLQALYLVHATPRHAVIAADKK